MQNLYNPEYQRLLEQINEDILSVPTLTIPDPSRIFYIKTDWSNYGMGSLLLQADVSVESRKSEAQEKDGGKCEFDKSLAGIRL